jgi:3-methylfumaryl-CoA hydratase
MPAANVPAGRGGAAGSGAQGEPAALDMGNVPVPPWLEGWQPIETQETDVVTPRSLVSLCDLLDDGNGARPPGRRVPILWHWLAFLPRAAQHDLGPDGHPRRGGFLPPVPLPRRMIGGGRVELTGRIEADAPLRRRGRVVLVQEKHGRSGDLVLVRLRFQIASAESATGRVDGDDAGDSSRGSERRLLVEEQDILYRRPPEPGREPAQGPPVGEDHVAFEGPEAPRWAWRWDLTVEPTLLFRFSALTYNAHRIHYDRTWATDVEGYPGLVVHGPLQAVALAELCRRNDARRMLSGISYRSVRPKFDDGPLLLRGSPVGTRGVELAAFDEHGVQTMRATATFDEPSSRP